MSTPCRRVFHGTGVKGVMIHKSVNWLLSFKEFAPDLPIVYCMMDLRVRSAECTTLQCVSQKCEKWVTPYFQAYAWQTRIKLSLPWENEYRAGEYIWQVDQPCHSSRQRQSVLPWLARAPPILTVEVVCVQGTAVKQLSPSEIGGNVNNIGKKNSWDIW